MRRLMALAILVATAVLALGGQTPGTRAFLLFVDDLHLDFRQTPRTRALMQRLLREVPRDGDIWSLVTTGASSLSVAPTMDLAVITGAISRVTGNALKPSERLPATPGSNATLEPQHRAEVSYRTGARAIDVLAAAAPGASLTILLVSDGYDTRQVTSPRPLIDAAMRAGATLFAIRPGILEQTVAADVPAAEWAAYVAATQDALRTLAIETGGLAVFTKDDLDPLLQRLTPGR